MKEVLSKNRPQMHITGEQGWINDPNGLVTFNGEYHVFFQYYPHDVKWGPMHWGHVKSKDLLHWEYLPTALYPDDEKMCFSGSAIVWQDKMWLLYTGHHENNGGDSIVQIQCLASSSDGVHFEKHGVVIGKDLLPSDYLVKDFRDPKVFRHNDAFYCVIAAKHVSGKGRIVLYKSNDLFNWQFCGDVLGKDSDGNMVECPDYNPNLQMLAHSQQFPTRNGYEHCNIHSTYYCFGQFDGCDKFVCDGNQHIVDYGFDFYAPQTFDNEPIMIGWLNMWDRSNPSSKYGFAGQLTIPRRLSVKDGRLYQEPICTTSQVDEKCNFTSLTDKLVVGKITLDADNLRGLSIKLRQKGNSCATLDLQDGLFVFNRSNCGEQITVAEKDEDSLNGIRRMPFDAQPQTHIEIVSDLYSLEIFVDGRAMSSLVYPDHDADGLEITIDADACVYKKYQF